MLMASTDYHNGLKIDDEKIKYIINLTEAGARGAAGAPRIKKNKKNKSY